jgi:hypothetical protein
MLSLYLSPILWYLRAIYPIDKKNVQFTLKISVLRVNIWQDWGQWGRTEIKFYFSIFIFLPHMYLSLVQKVCIPNIKFIVKQAQLLHIYNHLNHLYNPASLGTSVSNSSFDQGYTGCLKNETGFLLNSSSNKVATYLLTYFL